MKIKTTILVGIVATFILIATNISCTRDATEQASNPPESHLNKKGESLYSELCNSLFQMWNKCDFAYRNDSAAFMTACHDENWSSFYNITGINQEQREHIAELGRNLLSYYNYDSSILEQSTCIPCQYGGLKNLGTIIRALRIKYDQNIEAGNNDTIPDMAHPVDSCFAKCQEYLVNPRPDIDFDLCMFYCTVSSNLNDGDWDDIGPIIEP